MREKLIELLKDDDCPLLWMQGDVGGLADYLIANGVTFATDNNVGGWIPVTERLPEEKGFYLTARRRDVFVEQWNGVLFSQRCLYAQPTHWMPLPEPPKEG